MPEAIKLGGNTACKGVGRLGGFSLVSDGLVGGVDCLELGVALLIPETALETDQGPQDVSSGWIGCPFRITGREKPIYLEKV